MKTLVLKVLKILSELSSRTSGVVDKVYGWKVILSEIIWRLQKNNYEYFL